MWRDNILRDCVVVYFCCHGDRKACQVHLPLGRAPRCLYRPVFWILGSFLVGWKTRVPLCFSKFLDDNPYTGCILEVEAHWETHARNWLSGMNLIQEGKTWDPPSQGRGRDRCVQCLGRLHLQLWSQSSRRLLSVEGLSQWREDDACLRNLSPYKQVPYNLSSFLVMVYIGIGWQLRACNQS